MSESYVRRYLEDAVKEDLQKKMVFIAGPRQSGKTTLARKIQRDLSPDAGENFYLNWDSAADRERIIREQFPAGEGVLVLDEVHKYPRWRQVVKGLFDRRKDELKILVTGSGRLDYYRRGGESLQGRYYFYRLHPFTLKEVHELRENALDDLFKYGGFPEPFLMASERESRRWSRDYRERIIYGDLTSLENVREIGLVENLALRLPDLVGSPLSINALREDLQVSHQTVLRWLEIFERLYMIFRIFPYGPPRIRAVKKEAKHYHFDWTLVNDPGARFENLVAVHLLKWIHFRQDFEGLDTELRYFRRRDGREVDFVILKDRRPVLFLECRLRAREINKTLIYLKNHFPDAEAVQIVLFGGEDYVTREGIRVRPAKDFLLELV